MKKQVKEKVEETGLMFLKDNIKCTVKSIEYTHFEVINYLTSVSLLTIQKKKEAFKTRTRMKKSRIRETSNLLTDADRRTDTILERLSDLSKKKILHNFF